MEMAEPCKTKQNKTNNNTRGEPWQLGNEWTVRVAEGFSPAVGAM